jgi:hypothetical protein
MKSVKNSILYIILAISPSSLLFAYELSKDELRTLMKELDSYYSSHLRVKDKYPKSCQIADATFYHANCESLFDLPDPRINHCQRKAEEQYKNMVSSAYTLCHAEQKLRNQGELKEDNSWTLVSDNEMQDLANTLLPLHKENKIATTFGKQCDDFYKLFSMKDSKEWIDQLMWDYKTYEEPLKVKNARFKQFKQLKYALCKIDMASKEHTPPDLGQQPEKETPQALLERKIKNLVSQGKLSFKEMPSLQDLKVLAILAKEMEKEGVPIFSSEPAKKDKEEL